MFFESSTSFLHSFPYFERNVNFVRATSFSCIPFINKILEVPMAGGRPNFSDVWRGKVLKEFFFTIVN